MWNCQVKIWEKRNSHCQAQHLELLLHRKHLTIRKSWLRHWTVLLSASNSGRRGQGEGSQNCDLKGMHPRSRMNYKESNSALLSGWTRKVSNPGIRIRWITVTIRHQAEANENFLWRKKMSFYLLCGYFFKYNVHHILRHTQIYKNNTEQELVQASDKRKILRDTPKLPGIGSSN